MERLNFSWILLISRVTVPHSYAVKVHEKPGYCVQAVDPRILQINLTGFLEKNTSLFVKVSLLIGAALLDILTACLFSVYWPAIHA